MGRDSFEFRVTLDFEPEDPLTSNCAACGDTFQPTVFEHDLIMGHPDRRSLVCTVCGVPGYECSCGQVVQNGPAEKIRELGEAMRKYVHFRNEDARIRLEELVPEDGLSTIDDYIDPLEPFS